jgi:coatomer subunit epsilon
VLYRARAHIALGDPRAVARLIAPDETNVALRAAAALARYVAADEADSEETLEQLRDLCVEIEEADAEGEEEDKGAVRVLAGTAFIRAGETEEALETLGVGSDAQNLEACVPSFFLFAFLCPFNPTPCTALTTN